MPAAPWLLPILEGPAPAPNGDRLIARHPDGAVFEYIETGDQRP